MKKLFNYFWKGLIFTVPVGLTAYIVYYIFEKIDTLFGMESIPGVGFLLTISAITLIGFLASNIFTKGLLSLVDRLFTNLPFVKLLYRSIKDMVGAFVGDQKSFNQPVVVTVFPGGTAKAFGFITKNSMDAYGLINHVAVYFPQSYNFAGNVLLFPAEQVTPIKVDSADLMTFIVSGGVSGKEFKQDFNL